MLAALGVIATICTIILGVVTSMQAGCEARLTWFENHEKDMKIKAMNEKLAAARAEKRKARRNCKRRNKK